MKRAFLLMAFLVSFIAQAEDSGLQGKWHGKGQWTYQGSGQTCIMGMAFSETDAEFKRVGGHFACDVVDLTSPERAMVKKGDQLLENDKVIGKIQKDFVEFTEPYNEQTNVVTTMRLEGKQMHYQEIWYEKGNRVLYRITGELFLINSGDVL